ncbi:WAP domain-containing protein [Caerostris darwini]|uniref:WAP domain-containing protein n=1 Tax=Caerostris darwini TaxID=1538125 RepID=A0AAV4RXS9_9ARAC|nr:WAP domain-containing protein [Caerostris darwini]
MFATALHNAIITILSVRQVRVCFKKQENDDTHKQKQFLYSVCYVPVFKAHAQLDIFTTAFIKVFCVFHFCCFDLILLATLRTSKMKLIIVLLLTVLALSAVQANFCPARSNIQCIRASNQCCSDSDCKDGKICCGENCGNACKSPPEEFRTKRKMKIVFLLTCLIVGVTTFEAFCPARYSWDCPYFVNECCSDYDCDENQLCCEENCGNTCQFYSSYPTNGHRVEYYSYCRVDPRFIPPPHMPPP